MTWDYLVVGAGLFGATFTEMMRNRGKSVLVIDKRPHIAGNAYTEKQEGIDVHMYGPHIFHTNSDRIWRYVTKFATFNNFILSPKAIYQDNMYSLPFNMNTFYEMWGVKTPEAAKQMIESQKFHYGHEPQNLEEMAISTIGYDIYHKLIKGYTTKQWRKHPIDLPPEIIKRLPIRFTFDNNYFNDKYQGIPIEGYTRMVERMLSNTEVRLNVNFFDDITFWMKLAKKVVYTGKIDEFFNYVDGELEYLSLDFTHHFKENADNHQGCAQINYTDECVPYTRTIEHKHFVPSLRTPYTVVTTETPVAHTKESIPYYPVNDKKNMELLNRYKSMAKIYAPNVIFGGRLAEYRYYNMDQVIASAMKAVQNEFPDKGWYF